jgi:hypothetical protein
MESDRRKLVQLKEFAIRNKVNLALATLALAGLITVGGIGATIVKAVNQAKPPQCDIFKGSLPHLASALSEGAYRLGIGLSATIGYTGNHLRTSGNLQESLGYGAQGVKYTAGEAVQTFTDSACEGQ